MLEIETKLKVESHEPIRERLKAVGADFISHVLERNFIFDRIDGSLRTAGCGLRVRETQPLNGAQSAALLTFKGPCRSSAYKSRTEINIVVDSGVRTREMLAALEFKEIMFFEKRRETWNLDSAQVELDELPLLGNFVEIEGPDEKTIHQVQQRIGLSEHRHIETSYLSLLSDFCRRTGSSSRRVCFDAPAAE